MRQSRTNTLISLAVILPSMLLLGLFVYGFIGNSFYVSLTDWGAGAGLRENPVKNFVGLENYKQLFTGFIHERFRQDLVNAVFYSLFLVGGALGIGLFLAILLDRAPRGETFFRTTFLYPMALSFVVTGTIWRWLLAPNGGINLIPTWFGGEKIDFLWLSSQETVLTFNWQNIPLALSVGFFLFFAFRFYKSRRAGLQRRSRVYLGLGGLFLANILVGHWVLPPILPTAEEHGLNLAIIGVVIAAIWQYSGYTMALYLAGLRGLPMTIYESAKMDGASDFLYYRKIAIPNLKPITLSAIIILSHISLKMFALIFAMAGADNAATGHPSVLMYLVTFRANKFAQGASIAMVLFALAALFIIPYLIQNHRERR